jgi:hypothetical protein
MTERYRNKFFKYKSSEKTDFPNDDSSPVEVSVISAKKDIIGSYHVRGVKIIYVGTNIWYKRPCCTFELNRIVVLQRIRLTFGYYWTIDQLNSYHTVLSFFSSSLHSII